MMATAGKTTIVEVEELVEAGELGADNIHTPGIFVDRIVQGAVYEKRIERETVRSRETA
jgi:3-oxoacid CoA-transferase subunit A